MSVDIFGKTEEWLKMNVATPRFERSRLLLIELNEFDPDAMLAAARDMKLANVQRALSFRHAQTTTADRVEHHGLDPWVQWVGVHCGQPTRVHGVRRLGATRSQTLPQLWHEAAKAGLSWGAWGVMNAPMGPVDGCRFFMPDPWSFDETAYPAYLNDLLALPRYTAQNYLDVDYGKALKAALRLCKFFAPPSHWGLLAQLGGECASATLAAGLNVHTFTTVLDYLGVLLFVRLRKKSRPDLSIIFLNHIAHVQHQFWFRAGKIHPQLKLAFRLCDAMLGLLLEDRQPGEAVLVMNGMRQANVAGEGHYVYRQRNPQNAIEAMGIAGGRVEQCMTNDATILFADAKNADAAFDVLDQCRLSDGHKAFDVERLGPGRLFYQFAFGHDVQPDTRLISGNYSKPFYEVFELICERTGAHVPEGDVYCDGIAIPDRLENHQIFDLALRHLRGETVPA
jgi:hypothetical protein